MLTPQQPKGSQAAAGAKISVVCRLLEQTLAEFGSADKTGQAILKALTTLREATKKSEESSDQLMPAELKSALLAQGPTAASASPSPPPKIGNAQAGGMPMPLGAAA